MPNVSKPSPVKDNPIYCSTYCNFGHYIKTGRPVGHECRIIPPSALKAEMEDRFDDAIAIMQASPVRVVDGRKAGR